MKALLHLLAMLCLVVPALAASRPDPCSRLAKDAVERTQGAPLVTAKPTVHDDGRLTSESCYFKMNPESSSVSLEILTRAKGDEVDLHQFWESHFADSDEKDGKKEAGEEREHRVPPQRVSGLGSEAYWVDTGRDGALYVLTKSEIIRLSLGGSSDRETKKSKSIELLKHALD